MRRVAALLTILVALFVASPVWAGYGLLTHTSFTTVNTGTSSAIDTSGASLLIVGVTDFTTINPTISDSKGNTWTSLTLRTATSVEGRIYYAENPTVGSGHTFTSTGTGQVSTITIAAFSGAKTSGVFDQQNGANFTTNSTSVATGSVTPSEDNELIVAIVGTSSQPTGSTFTIDLSFTVLEQQPFVGGNNYSGALAYLIQTSAAAKNPTYSWTGTSNEGVAAIATFKAAAGPALSKRKGRVF